MTFAAEDRAVWLDRLAAVGVPAAPVQDVAEVATAEQTEALGILQELAHPGVPDLRIPALPVSIPARRASRPPSSCSVRSSRTAATTPGPIVSSLQAPTMKVPPGSG